MNKLVICLFFMTIVIIKAQEEILYAEMFSQMMKNKEVLKRTSKQKMSDITDGKGFEHFVLKISQERKYVKDLMREINDMLDSDYMSKFRQSIKDQTLDFFKTINDNDILTSGKSRMYFDMSFVNEKGLMELFKYSVLEKDIGYKIDIVIIVGNFTPAKPYTIVSYSYSNMFREEYSEDIKYLPATFTMEHVDFILKVTGNILTFFEKGTFGPLLSDKYYEIKEKNGGKRMKRRSHDDDEDDDDDDNDYEEYENKRRHNMKYHKRDKSYGNENNLFKNENNFIKMDV